MNLRLRLSIEWLLIGLVSSIIVLAATRWDGTASFDYLFYDQLSSVSRPPADDNVLLVNIDDPSLATLGNWPWPRSTHAKLIQILQASKPRSITLDVILSESGIVDDDVALAAAMRGGAPVFVPLHFSAPGDNGRAYNVIPPAPIFAQAASGIGQVDVVFDRDGTVRQVKLCADPENDSNHWPHIMELAYRSGSAKASPAYARNACEKTLLLPFAKRGTHSEISYADILDGGVPTDLIKGRDIIIGASAAGMRDNFPVPLGDGGLLAGSEVMANMLTAIKRDSFITPVSYTVILLFSLLPMWLLLIGFLQWTPRTALITSIGMVFIILIGSAAGLTVGIWFPPGAALLGMLLVYPLWGWRRLQAVSDFMASELNALENEGEAIPLKVRQAKAGDLVANQSAALAGAIDHMRDLRHFIADTISDLPDPMIVTNLNDIVTMNSQLVETRLGRSILGLKFNNVLDATVVAEHRMLVADYISRNTTVQKPVGVGPISTTTEFVRFSTINGNTFVMRKSAIEATDGAIVGYIHYLADISALAQAEDERERVLQLLSHDMRAPQSAIIALMSGKIDAKARARIERNARRTMQLAQDFVDIARMSETEFAGEDILLPALVRDTADNFWPLAKERGISIVVGGECDDGFVFGEPDILSRAFANLIDNAIKFSPDNGIIDISIMRITSAVSNLITVKICDQGRGIDPDILPRLFQRFATGGDHKGRVKGSGLGLSFVSAVIKRHRGSVSAENIGGGGACFTMTLPEADETDA